MEVQREELGARMKVIVDGFKRQNMIANAPAPPVPPESTKESE